MARSAVAVVVLLLATLALNAEAWGSLGHRVVGDVAYAHLSSTARAVVDRYLDGTTLALAAVYPDTYRGQGGSWSSSLHFLNFPRDADHYIPAYCYTPPDCVVAAISNYTQRLQYEGIRGPLCTFSSDEPCPLSFLAHFVGDIHQPLHAGWGDDKGGNNVAVIFDGRKTNLHSLWDSAMLEQYNSNQNSLTQSLEELITNNPGKVKKWLSTLDPVRWADEGLNLIKNDVYNFDAKPSGLFQADVEITEDYYNYSIPIILDQLAAAGLRLAALIDDALSQ
jgi:hypothetical protein